MSAGNARGPAVFYSWLSDLANNTNRGLIEKALELAIAEVAADVTIDVCPRLDDAGMDVIGAHDIAATILRKIEGAAVFVADISIIGNATPKRPTPNPNVLIEVGYALKALGPDRVILVFNEASGRVEDLPFDLRPRMTMPYRAEAGDSEEAQGARRAARKDLSKALASVIRSILRKDVDALPSPPSFLQRAVDGVAGSSADVRARVTEYMADLAADVGKRLPDVKGDRTDEALVKNIDESIGLVRDFANLAEVIGRNGSSIAAIAATRGLEKVMQLYEPAPPRQGPAQPADFDLPKFLGHELFVILIAALLRHEAFDVISGVLEVDLCVERHDGRQTHSWTYLSKFCRLLKDRGERLQVNLLSLHGSLLKSRHESEALAALSPFVGFVEADYFLYLAAALHPAEKPFLPGSSTWRGWSLAYMPWAEPTFLARAQSRRFAEKLLKPLRLSSVDDFRARYRERGLSYGLVFDSWGMFVDGGMDSELIASKP